MENQTVATIGSYDTILYVALAVIFLAVSGFSIYFIAKKLEREQDAWKGFVPILNLWLLLEITEKPWWWLLVMLILPPVGYILNFIISIELAEKRKLKKSWGILAASVPPIGLPILAFAEPLVASV